jgi:hypothetical protein
MLAANVNDVEVNKLSVDDATSRSATVLAEY